MNTNIGTLTDSGHPVSITPGMARIYTKTVLYHGTQLTATQTYCRAHRQMHVLAQMHGTQYMYTDAWHMLGSS